MLAYSLIPFLLAAPAGAAVRDSAVQDPFRTCDGVVVQHLIGRRADEKAMAEARRLSGAALVREIKAGQPVSMDYLSSRLNLELDRERRIVRIYCA